MNEKLDQLLSHLETFLPKPFSDEQWNSSHPFRWRRPESIFSSIGFLQPVKNVSDLTCVSLKYIERHRDTIQNTTKN